MKLLLVTSRYPWPPRRGDQLRAIQLLELLAPEVDVTLLAPSAPSGAPAPPPGTRIETYRTDGWLSAAAGVARSAVVGEPLQTGLFRHRDLGLQLTRLAPRHDLVMLQLVRLAPELARLEPHRCVIDLVDSLSLSTARRATFDQAWRRPILLLEAGRLARAEAKLARSTRRVIVVCERDRQAIAARVPDAADHVAVVPLAVAARVPSTAAPDSPLVTFTGNLGYFVNADAVRWFLNEVWPGIRARCPGARWVVAGDRPSRSLRQLLLRAVAQGVELIAAPSDLTPLLRRATLAIAPLRAGAGTPIKVLEAWSAGVPVLASGWAAAGTTARVGVDLVVAETGDEWVKTACRLLGSPEERQRLTTNARARLSADYSRDAVRRAFLDAIGVTAA